METANCWKIMWRSWPSVGGTIADPKTPPGSFQGRAGCPLPWWHGHVDLLGRSKIICFPVKVPWPISLIYCTYTCTCVHIYIILHICRYVYILINIYIYMSIESKFGSTQFQATARCFPRGFDWSKTNPATGAHRSLGIRILGLRHGKFPWISMSNSWYLKLILWMEEILHQLIDGLSHYL